MSHDRWECAGVGWKGPHLTPSGSQEVQSPGTLLHRSKTHWDTMFFAAGP
ncbi:MAG: hypothetical protein HYU36_02400 [Planctomycetes bacterium]|nr:hypothetical protein [Planctomycetota bacterium]